MRIHGQEQGTSSGYAKRETPQQKQFRNRYRIGDIIRATIVKYINSEMAKVSIDNLELLARLKTRYTEKANVHFVVMALYPDIVLQEAEKGSGKPGSGLHLIV